MKETNRIMARNNPLGHDFFIVSGYEIFQLHAIDLVMKDGTRLMDLMKEDDVEKCGSFTDVIKLTSKFAQAIVESNYKCEFWNINDKKGTFVSDYIISDEELMNLENNGLLFEDVKDAKEYVQMKKIENSEEKSEDGYDKCKSCFAAKVCPESTLKKDESDISKESMKNSMMKIVEELKEITKSNDTDIVVEPRRYSYHDGKIIDHKTGDTYGFSSLNEFFKTIGCSDEQVKMYPYTPYIPTFRRTEKLGEDTSNVKVTVLKDRYADSLKQGGFFVYIEEDNFSPSLFAKDTKWAYVKEIKYFRDDFCLVEFIYNTDGYIKGKKVSMGIADVIKYFNVSDRTYVSFPRAKNSQVESAEHYNDIKTIDSMYKIMGYFHSIDLIRFCNHDHDFYVVYKDKVNSDVILSYIKLNVPNEINLRRDYIAYTEHIIKNKNTDRKLEYRISRVDSIDTVFTNDFEYKFSDYDEALSFFEMQRAKTAYKKEYDDRKIVFVTNEEELYTISASYPSLMYECSGDDFVYVDVVLQQDASGMRYEYYDALMGKEIKSEELIGRELVVLKDGGPFTVNGEFGRHLFYVTNNIDIISKHHDIYKITGKIALDAIYKGFESFRASFYNEESGSYEKLEFDGECFFFNGDEYYYTEEDMDSLFEVLKDREFRLIDHCTILFEYFDDVDEEDLF